MSEASRPAGVESTFSQTPSAQPDPALEDIDQDLMDTAESNHGHQDAAENEHHPMEAAEIEQHAVAFTLEDLVRHLWHRIRYNLAPTLSCRCFECGACFDSEWELKRHMGHMHPKPVPIVYICTHCNRGFGKYSRMALHLTIVSAEVARRGGGDEARWPGPMIIGSRLNGLWYRRDPRRQMLLLPPRSG